MIFLSFDTEEFDVPRESDSAFDSLTEGVRISQYGLVRILDILKEEEIKATFFCTTNFAMKSESLIKRICQEGHELASHGCDHWNPQQKDIKESKTVLEAMSGKVIIGYRQPRMFPVNNRALSEAGYLYNASLNPTFIPGRYMHLRAKRLPHIEDEVVQIPASVTPLLRIPLFWCALHVFPFWLYKILCRWTLRKDKNINTYFHPWEFYPLKELDGLKIPLLITMNSGETMCKRLHSFIIDAKKSGEKFGTYSQYYQLYKTK